MKVGKVRLGYGLEPDPLRLSPDLFFFSFFLRIKNFWFQKISKPSKN
jgi:hypothetical protein